MPSHRVGTAVVNIVLERVALDDIYQTARLPEMRTYFGHGRNQCNCFVD